MKKDIRYYINKSIFITATNTDVGKTHACEKFLKYFAKNGFAVTRLEEWISHKESEKGLRKLAEDKARKEIPMFMMIEVKKW